MKDSIKAALITGILGLIGTGIGYFSGQNSIEQEVDNQISQTFNVENMGYDNAINYVLDRVDELEDENERLQKEKQTIQEENEDLKEQIKNNDENATVLDGPSVIVGEELIKLQDLKKIDSNWYEEIKPFEDSYGNQYETGYQFTASEDGYAVYSLQGKYTTFSAKVACSSETGAGADMSISVYVDDTFVETIPDITKEMEAKQIGPYDITGARKLSIKTANEGEYSHGNCYLVNAVVE